MAELNEAFDTINPKYNKKNGKKKKPTPSDEDTNCGQSTNLQSFQGMQDEGTPVTLYGIFYGYRTTPDNCDHPAFIGGCTSPGKCIKCGINGPPGGITGIKYNKSAEKYRRRMACTSYGSKIGPSVDRTSGQGFTKSFGQIYRR